MRFGYYLLTTYVPKRDGASPELDAHGLVRIDERVNTVAKTVGSWKSEP